MHSVKLGAALIVIYGTYLASCVPTPPQIAPTPRGDTPTLVERQDVTVIGTSTRPQGTAVCGLSPTDPSTFGNSGATLFLDNFLKTNGANDWLFKMDTQTTGNGAQPSALHCQALGGQTCPAPSVQCRFFTPPELFFLRVAATNAHDFFTAAHETLQNVVITEALRVDQLVADFAPEESTNNNDFLTALLKLVAPGFSMSDKVVKQGEGLGGKADLLGFIGGAIGLAAGAIALSDQQAPAPVSIATLTTNVENQLADIFTATNDNLSKLNAKLFGASNDLDLNQLISFVTSATGNSPDSNLQPIAQIFSTGAFMEPLDQSVLGAGLTAGFQLIKQQLVASLLAAQNFFVFVDTNRSLNDCNKITGSRFIDGQCFTIEKRFQNNIQCTADSKVIDAAIVLKFDNPSAGYNIDLPTFYKNVQECNNGQPASGLDVGSDLPRCAFGIPFVKAAGSICNAVGTPNLPASLQVNADSCNKVVCANPGFFGRCNC